MMSTQRKKVLIIGAGLAGLALYLALDKKKFDIEIVERRKHLSNLGFAVIFMPPGVRALRELGISASVIKRIGKPLQKIEMFDEKGQQMEPTRLDSFPKQFDDYVVVERATLYSALWRKIRKQSVRFGVSPTGFSHHEGKTVVRFSDKSVTEYDLVVAADGGNSVSRAMLFPKARATPQNRIFIWAWFPKKDFTWSNKVLVFVAKKYGLGFLDVPDPKRICGFLYADRDLLPKKITPSSYRKIWEQCFKGFSHPFTRIQAHLPSHKSMYLHEDREWNLKQWHTGSVVCIGDAAHARSVLTGAGTALALEDGVVLGSLLNETKSIHGAIRLFTKAQRARTQKMVPSVGKAQERLLQKFFASSPLFKKARK